jgi:hypothetical protein
MQITAVRAIELEEGDTPARIFADRRHFRKRPSGLIQG